MVHVSDPNLTAQVRRGLGWSVLSNITLRLGSLIVGVVLARLLVPEQFGVYAVALTVQSVLMTLADLGLSADLVRSQDPERRAPTVATLGLVCGALLASAMALSAGSLANAMNSPESRGVIMALSVTLLLAGAGVVPFALLQRRLDQRKLFLIAALDFAISTPLTLTLVMAGWGVMALAVGRIAGQALTLGMMFYLAGRRPRFHWDRHVAASVLAFGVPVASANVLSWALLTLDNVVIARVAGPTALGLYVLAFNISNWPMSAIGSVVRSVALPAFARSSQAARERGFVTASGLTWALALLASAMLAGLAVPLVLVVYGERWSPAAVVLMALALFGGLRVVFDLMVAYLLARGASSSVLVVQVLWFATLLPAMVFATTRYGIEGGAWAHLVVSVMVILPAYLVCLRRAGVRLSALASVAWPPLLAVIPSAGVAVAANRVFDSPVAALLVGGSCGAAVYFALLGRWLLTLARGTPDAQVATTEPETEVLPHVSVVIPCFNYARWLPEAVESALGQSGVRVEVVIVDDASTDDSQAVAHRLAEADPRVQVVLHHVNQGPVATFNDGLALARGEFLVRLDADDLLTPGSLARSAAVCRRFPEVGLVYGHPVHFAGEVPAARSRPTCWTVWSGSTWLEDRCSSGVNVITSPEAFMRMSVVRAVGGQRELKHTHDMEMWLRIATVADVAYIQGADQAWHREHPASLSTGADDALGLTILRDHRAAFDHLGSNPDFPAGRTLAALARRTLASEALRRATYEYDRGRAPGRPIDELVSFAMETDRHASSLPECRALAERMDDPRRLLRMWHGLASPCRRVVRDRVRSRRWSKTGVYSRVAPLTTVWVRTGAGRHAQPRTAPSPDIASPTPTEQEVSNV